MRKRVIVACDSFKGSLTSKEAGEACCKGILDVCPEAEVSVISVADGGEGTTEALAEALDASRIECMVSDPLGRPVAAHYILSRDGHTAVMEMAAASGLGLVPATERNPLNTDSRGTGEMILDAAHRGATEIVMGIGGSATVDGGMGMLAALGVNFYDADGNRLEHFGGATLEKVDRIDLTDLDPLVGKLKISVICDVDNPLCGENGAARIFGPQKGADPLTVERLESGMMHYADAIERYAGFGVRDIPGGGAAGGMGMALTSLLGASLKSGIDVVLDLIDFDRRIAGASLVITGEGRLDSQTLHGKTPFGIMLRARRQGIPTVAVGGSVESSKELTAAGFAAVLPIIPAPCTLEEAMRPATARANLRRTAATILSLLRLPG